MTKTFTTIIEHDGKEYPFRIFDNPSDRGALPEVFHGKSYPIDPNARNIRTIVDIGAHCGAASVYFHIFYPKATIYSFEPSPKSCELLQENAANIPEIHPINQALSDHAGMAHLLLHPGGHCCDCLVLPPRFRSVWEGGLDDRPNIIIPVLAAATAFQENGIGPVDILKLDAEGQEVPILHSLAARLSTIAVIYVEYHCSPDRLEIDRLLSPSHDLRYARILNGKQGELCYVIGERNSSAAPPP